MRRDAALSLRLGTNGTNDLHGFYAACLDEANGYAYFGATYVYKVDVKGAAPAQVGSGVSLGRQASFAVMDSAAGCAYFCAGSSIYQILANGTNGPSLGAVMSAPFGGSTFFGQLLIDTTDPANHYLYAMTETDLTNSTLYKIALNQFPSAGSVVGSASANPGEPAMYYGAIDLTNRCAYFGTFLAISNAPYVTKFALGAGAGAPSRIGGLALDNTIRAIGGMALDIPHGFGYCCSDDSDVNFGHARLYKWALNGSAAATLVSSVDFHTNEGYCHVAVIKPEQGLLYFGSDLSYPAKVHRFRLTGGTNAPVETGTLLCEGTTNPAPAWATNPTNNAYWGEVFIHSVAYDRVHDFAYFGRDDADGQVGFYSNEIVKVALDRDEMLVKLTEDRAAAPRPVPERESFESYSNGFSVSSLPGWSAEDTAMAVVSSNADGYAGIFPINQTHDLLLEVNGAVTNSFSPPANQSLLMDAMIQAKYWTDPQLPALSNAPLAFCVTTNGRLAVWNCLAPPAPAVGWTELADTSIGSNDFARVTVEMDFQRDRFGDYYFRVWVDGVVSTNPQTWYAATETNQSTIGGIVAQGSFALDDLVVAAPTLSLSSIEWQGGAVNLTGDGAPGLAQRIWAADALATPVVWRVVATNEPSVSGGWSFLDTTAAGAAARFYRASLP